MFKGRNLQTKWQQQKEAETDFSKKLERSIHGDPQSDTYCNHCLSAETPRAMQVNSNDPLITMCVSLSGIISATIISQLFISQCENRPPHVSYQEAAPLILEAKENISPIQSTSVNFTLFFLFFYIFDVSLSFSDGSSLFFFPNSPH